MDRHSLAARLAVQKTSLAPRRIGGFRDPRAYITDYARNREVRCHYLVRKWHILRNHWQIAKGPRGVAPQWFVVAIEWRWNEHARVVPTYVADEREGT